MATADNSNDSAFIRIVCVTKDMESVAVTVRTVGAEETWLRPMALSRVASRSSMVAVVGAHNTCGAVQRGIT